MDDPNSSVGAASPFLLLVGRGSVDSVDGSVGAASPLLLVVG